MKRPIKALPIALIGLGTVLGGCTSFGTNIGSDFSCPPGDGVCAPAGLIDNAAVAEMNTGVAQKVDDGFGIKSNDVYRANFPGGGDKVQNRAQSVSFTGPPARTGEHALKIVFPAKVGRDGTFHDARTAYVVVKAPEWTKAAQPTGQPENQSEVRPQKTATQAQDTKTPEEQFRRELDLAAAQQKAAVTAAAERAAATAKGSR